MFYSWDPAAIGAPGRIGLLEELLDYIDEFDGVWWATGKEMYAYYQTLKEREGNNMASLWSGRFEKDMDDIVKQFNASIGFDQRMYNEDIDGSIAHVTMLGEQGIVSMEEKDIIIKGLEEIREEIASGKIVLMSMMKIFIWESKVV